MSAGRGKSGVFGPLLYGSMFCVVLPLLLWQLATLLDARLKLTFAPWPIVGPAVAALGAALTLWAMWMLIVRGQGLPMNAYPTTRRVQNGVYAWLAHPAYVGFVALMWGVFLWRGSFAGVFIVTPCTALAALALVVGYERRATDLRLGARASPPFTNLPPDVADAPSVSQQFGALAAVFLPWLSAYCCFAALAPAQDAFSTYFAFERDWPFWPAFVVAYSFTYVFALAVPFFCRTQAQLRQFVLAGWVGTAAGVLIYAVLPAIAPLRGTPPDNWVGQWLQLERGDNIVTAALPSFHAFWIVLAACFWRLRLPAVLVLGLAALQGVACHLTGMHSLADLLAGVLLAVVALNSAAIWKRGMRAAEWVANDWRPMRLGRMRVFPHAGYVVLAALVGCLVAACWVQADQLPNLAGLALAGLLGAMVLGQWVEASSVLARPLGFFGGIGAAGLLAVWWLAAGQIDASLLAAGCLGLPWVQALGRLRCLAQGCCHGGLCSAATSAYGMVYRHPLSRVGVLAQGLGRPLAAAPVFSMLCNLVLGLLLWRVADVTHDAWLVVVAYLVGMSLARFAEEGLRSEPQTPVRAGLTLYQWLSMVWLAVAIALLWAPVVNMSVAHAPDWAAALLGLALSGAWAVAMSVDWPESRFPLSRLTPGNTPSD